MVNVGLYMPLKIGIIRFLETERLLKIGCSFNLSWYLVSSHL